MWNPMKKKKIPSKIIKLLYDARASALERREKGLPEYTFEEFKEQLEKDFEKVQKDKS